MPNLFGMTHGRTCGCVFVEGTLLVIGFQGKLTGHHLFFGSPYFDTYGSRIIRLENTALFGNLRMFLPSWPLARTVAVDAMFMAHAEETSGEAIASKTPVNRISLLRREYVTRSLNGIKRNVQSKQLLGDWTSV